MESTLSILVDAKREYTDKLISLMAPVMIDVFHEMFQEASKLSNNRKVLQMFQKLLKEVPNWSNAMSKQHTDNLVNKCSWFNDLLAAVFVSHVKILSAVRLKTENRKLSLKLPTNEVFVQTVYNNAARELYNDPYIFNEVQSEYARDKELFKRFGDVIETTIKELLPVQHILQTYMGQTDENIDVEDSDPVDDDDVDHEQEMGEEEEEEQGEDALDDGYKPPEQSIDPPPAPTTTTEMDSEIKPPASEGESSVPFEHEVGGEDIKTISTQTQGEEESLFDDAPEQRTKKLRYM
uniref:Uncharacterized protein n=1 Tax=viral metagenome TaxID=1070528 RepID=A0A6C0JTU8_9ZZZZ